MLPEPALSLIREQSQIRLHGVAGALDDVEQRVTGRVYRGLGGRPPLCKGRLNRELIALHDQMVREVMEAARRVIENLRTPPYEQMANDLAEILLKEVESMERSVQSRREPYPGLGHPKDIPQVGDAVRRMHVWLRSECNLLAATTKSAWEERKASGAINVYSEQSGDNSRVNVNSDDRSVNITNGSCRHVSREN